jgi:two-component system chemotaxis response regulator CheB
LAHSLKPDVVTMDLEMPVMGGIEAIEKIMQQSPVPILVVTSQTGVRTAFAAISKGALDVFEKSDLDAARSAALIRKVKTLSRISVAAAQKVLGLRSGNAPANAVTLRPEGTQGKIVAIASSTGGPQALNFILARLPATFPAPIVISQHVIEGFSQGMADWLDAGAPLKVTMATNGAALAPGCVYLSPSESSMKITPQRSILLVPEEAGQVYHPSCDTLLTSVAQAYGPEALGLILSGMGDDGVAGMQAIKAAGGYTLAQDEQSSVVYGMNGVAVKQGCIDKILPLAEIPAELLRRTAHGKDK